MPWENLNESITRNMRIEKQCFLYHLKPVFSGTRLMRSIIDIFGDDYDLSRNKEMIVYVDSNPTDMMICAKSDCLKNLKILIWNGLDMKLICIRFNFLKLKNQIFIIIFILK